MQSNRHFILVQEPIEEAESHFPTSGPGYTWRKVAKNSHPASPASMSPPASGGSNFLVIGKTAIAAMQGNTDHGGPEENFSKCYAGT